MLNRVIKISAVLFIGCCIGATAIIISDYSDKVKPTFWGFNFIDVLSLITYSVIAIYIAYHLKNRFSDQQMKKNFFVGIANDIENIFEKDLHILISFMKTTPTTEEDRTRVLLRLRKVSNKIFILDENKQHFNKKIVVLVDNIRKDYKEIKEIITGDDCFTPQSFSEKSINDVIKFIHDIIFSLDKVKLNIFD